MRLEATQVQLASEVLATSDDIRTRYRENRHWRLYPKEWIYKNIPLAGKDILDFGCGTGEITIQLALLGARHVYALDVTRGLLDATLRRAELDSVADCVQTVCGAVQDVEPRPVDIVIAFAVLHHCFPLENVMPGLLRWLKPGGLFVAVEPISYLAGLEWLRNHSGISEDALDEGERKLNAADLQYVTRQISEPQIVYFHLLGRLSQLWRRAIGYAAEWTN
jgi:2-polyprenyl-3-methyl-5-hydroxy-6-metoxy-1,4-benzoquinol methylase